MLTDEDICSLAERIEAALHGGQRSPARIAKIERIIREVLAEEESRS